MTYIRIPHIITPRHYQIDALRAVKEGKNCFIVIHRRAGKDIICMQMLLLRALQRVGTHLYLAPMQTQIRQIIWKGMDFDGRPFMSAIPEVLVAKRNDARMEIELINGSRIVFAGSNNISGIIGTNPVTIIYSEFSLHNPLVRQYLNPILIQNNGLEIMQMTPRGKNHAWEVMEAVRDNPRYFMQHLSVEQTFKDDGSRVISEAQIIEAKHMGMSEEMVRQEFFCDFDIGNMGAYYTRELSDMEREGRITTLRPNPNFPLHTAWDLGSVDATACWMFQLEGQYINLLHFIHDSGKPLKHYLELCEQIRKSMGCGWGNHFAPHDISQRHQGFEQVESRLIQARKYGWHFQVTPKVNIDDGIEATRYALTYMRIDPNACATGLRALREYQRLYDDVKSCYSPKPLDNWATHAADAIRYLAVNYKRLYAVPVPSKQYEYVG